MQHNLLTIETDEYIATLNYFGLVEGQNYKDGMENFIKLVKPKPKTLWLFNFKKGDKIPFAEQQWTLDTWLPQIIKTINKGVKKLAVIASENIFSKVSLRIITTKMRELDINIAFFSHEHEAKAWLLESSTKLSAK